MTTTSQLTQLTKKETIALLVAGICGTVTNPENPKRYIFISRGTRKKSNWIDTVLASLSTRIDGLTPHFDRFGDIVPGAFWVSKEISNWADSYDKSSEAYKGFRTIASN